MPDPVELLPPEVFDQVVSLVESDLHWRRLGLVSRRWHSFLAPRLYHSWTYDGAYDDYRPLWIFLQWTLRNPHLAALVQKLWIGNWGVNLRAVLHQEFSDPLDDQDRDLVRQAIGRTHLSDLESQIMQGLRDGDRRPLMVLLLAHLPNVSTIYAHVPLVDPFLLALLHQALEDQGNLLQNLQNVYVFGEVPVSGDPLAIEEEGSLVEVEVPLRLDYIWPVLYLKSLHRLAIYDLETEGLAELLQQRHSTAARCRLQHLTVRVGFESSSKAADIHALINVPESLLSLELFINDESTIMERNPCVISNPDLRIALNKHRDSLQHLDICRSSFPNSMNPHPGGGLGSLKSFSQLKHLLVEFDDLIMGNQEEGLYVPTIRLKDALPPGLTSLVIYSWCTTPDAVTHFREVIAQNTCPGLRSLIVQWSGMYIELARDLQEGLSDIPFDFQAKSTCSHNTETTHFDHLACDMPQGGSCTGFWGLKTINMRTTGQQRYLDTMHNLFPGTHRLIDDDDPDSFATTEVTALPPFFDAYHPYFTPFTDHTGRTGYMYFKNYDTRKLPPLFSFVLYFTRPNTVPEISDLDGLFDTLTEDAPIRLDIFFLPGANEQDCIAHYRGELAVRGCYTEQIDMYRDYLRQGLIVPRPPPPPGKLPGMVESYGNSGHKMVFFMCSEQDWGGEQETLWYVDFGLKARGREEPAEENPVLEIDKELRPIEDVKSWMSDAYDGADMGKWSRIWKDASRRGWNNWC